MSTWLHRILHNKFIDAKRKRQPDYDQAAVDVMAADASLATAPQDADLLQRIDAELNALPENQRAALSLAQLQGFSNKEVAHILGLSVRATESLLARARRTMRQNLSD